MHGTLENFDRTGRKYYYQSLCNLEKLDSLGKKRKSMDNKNKEKATQSKTLEDNREALTDEASRRRFLQMTAGAVAAIVSTSCY
jgi:hypothetical protein